MRDVEGVWMCVDVTCVFEMWKGVCVRERKRCGGVCGVRCMCGVCVCVRERDVEVYGVCVM